MKTLIIGDIHGCWEELQDLLDRAGIGDDDVVIAIGDVVDRGPGSVEALGFFRDRPGARALMGNHERKHIRWRRGELRPALSQRIARRQFGEAGWAQACEVMEGFELFIELPDALLVHGFFEPGKPVATQRDNVLVGTMTGERHIKAQGHDPWYTGYDGDKPLVVGHHNYTDSTAPLVWRDRVYGLDTSCCHGGALTGLLLPEWRLISVPARGDHWSRLKTEHADLRYTHTPLKALDWEALETLVSRADRDPDPHPAALERIDALRDLNRDAQMAIDTIYAAIQRRAEAILAGIDAKDAREEGSLFAKRLGETPMASLYHLHRRGALTRAHVLKYFAKPIAAVAAGHEHLLHEDLQTEQRDG